MSQNIVLSFALLFGATIALICAIYLLIGMRRRQRRNNFIEMVNPDNQQS